MKLTEQEKNFSEWLKESHLGEENSITAKKMRSWGDSQTIRGMVNSLRRNGVPICSGHSGYYYARTSKEVKMTLEHLHSRYWAIKEAEAGLLKTFSKMYENES